MITVSVCMIVKNEEESLGDCLDCLKEFADEIIIVDTGSSDNTKNIAAKYTDKIYDFEWIDDFAAARNFSFSKATMDYIYVADADELIDETNQKRLMILKEAMLPEVEIVQMKYTNQLKNGTTYNFDVEYRGKLYKRLREFNWVDPIHETVNIDPVVFDSDIEIIHNAHECHASRDFEIFKKVIKRGERLSNKLVIMYAKELFIAGTDSDFKDVYNYFYDLVNDDNTSEKIFKEAACVYMRATRLLDKQNEFLEFSLKMAADNPSSEVCYEIGEYFYQNGNYKEATVWFYNAAFECEPMLNIHYGGDYSLERLADSFEKLGNVEQYSVYMAMANDWRNSQG